MNPIKNKKNLEATINDIKNLAHSYLEKYSTSKQQLRIYLFKNFTLWFKLFYEDFKRSINI